MNGADIKRVLGVGMATLTEHLREYKDPFELEECELCPLPIEPCRNDTNQILRNYQAPAASKKI